MSADVVTVPTGWSVTHVAATDSTNADLVLQAAAGAPHGTVLVADVQHAGRGRLGRTWTAPPGTALLFSVLLRPALAPIATWGWVGAMMGMSIVAALRRTVDLDAQLKWPNDVLIDGRKVAGILAEVAGDAVVVGAGLNVTLPADLLPRADATSLVLAGADGDKCRRGPLLEAVLTELEPRLAAWERAGGDVEAAGVRSEYVGISATVDSNVALELPDGGRVVGRALTVRADGALMVDTGGAVRAYTAGDVVHLRKPE